jgi:arylsulfatase A-like enzyme
VTPNILLVVLDAARRDALEPYGPQPGTTPAIAELARSGRVVQHAYSAASWTLPSHASMLTGLLGRQLGLGQAPAGSPQSARPALEKVRDRLLPQVLRGAGYATHGYSTNLWISEFSGFDIGFDSFIYSGEHRRMARGRLFRERPDARIGWAIDGLRARSDDGAAQMRDRLIGSIERWSGQPTFWFVNLCECHSPYLPPRPWNDLGPADRVRAALEAQRHLNFQSICLYAAGRWEIPDEAFARMRYLYGRAIGYMDQWLGDVLEALDRRGLLEDTTIIVTSDHGENFGENGLIAHGFSVDQRLIHVPLILAGPGAGPWPEPFSLADMPAMIAPAAGLSDHPWQQREMPPGIVVSEYDQLGTPEDPRIRGFAARWQLDEAAVGKLTPTLTCATDGKLKLVNRHGSEQLFDVSTDPLEVHPLDPASANGGLDGLRQAIENSQGAQRATAIADNSPPTASPDELEAIERQMKLLGYM